MGEGRALLVLDGANFLCQRQSLRVGDWILAFLAQLFNLNWILAEIRLSSYEDNWRTRAVMRNFWVPLGAHIFKGGTVDQTEADEKDVLKEKILFNKKIF